MSQKGLKLNNSLTIDSLLYTYQTNSNKLAKVADRIVTSDNGKLSDFKDCSNGATDDYSFDGNGNLQLDNNKAISSITYNHLNLPSVITVTGKGTITYTYDAAGNKLSKQTVEGVKTTTTKYIGGFVYQNDSLQFIGQEEGRIRPKRMNYSDTMYYDYFEKDHLGNVRSVLTDELQTDAYPPASFETAQLALETTFYSNMDLGVDKTSTTGYPSDTYTNPNDKIAKIRADTRKIGPGITLKVMAGDKFNFRVSSWYKTNGTVPTPPVGLATEIVYMMTHTVGAASGGKYTLAELDASGAFIPGAGQFLQDYTTGYITSRPKAYVNWILYDEQFNYVSSSSGAEQVGDNLEFKIHVRNNMPIDRNGYLYVYTSTETANIDVFFDNLQVTHIRGPLLEETNYYPFGLTMSGISSKALKTNYAENKNEKFQGQPLDDDLGLNWYGFKWRNKYLFDKKKEFP